MPASLQTKILIAIATLSSLATSRLAIGDDPKTPWRQHISGNVLTPDGKPIAGADVFIFAEIGPRTFFDPDVHSSKIVGRTKTDAGGHFEIDNTQPMTPQIQHISILVSAKDYALEWRRLPLDDDKPHYEFKLSSPHEIRGQIFIDDEPLADGAAIQIHELGRRSRYDVHLSPYDTLEFGTSTELPPEIIRPAVKTNDRGEIAVGRLPADALVRLRTSDPALEPCTWTWSPGSEPLKVAISPARIVTGTVVAADDRKPIAGASVSLWGSSSPLRGKPISERTYGRTVYGVTDEEGHFKLAAGPAGLATIRAPAGMPYLPTRISMRSGANELKVSLELGTLVAGRVIESATGQPVSDAEITYWSHEKGGSAFGEPIATSDKDGNFSCAVPSGPGELLILVTSCDYVFQPATFSLARNGPFAEEYVFARRQIDVPQSQPNVRAALEDIEIALQKGVTVRGQVVGADGKPLEIVRLAQIDPSYGGYTDNYRRLPFSHGRLVVNGVPPDGEFPIALVDPIGKQGKSLMLHGSDAKQPLVVTLEPCGSLTFHVRDGEGKPVAGFEPQLFLRISTTTNEADASDDDKNKTGFAFPQRLFDYINCFNLMSDEQGVVAVPTIVPGLTYSLQSYNERGGLAKPREFAVKPGEHVDLPDIVISSPATLQRAKEKWAERQKQ